MTSANLNKKLCWNCEGNVEKEAVQCLYCGVTLTPSYEDEAPPYQISSQQSTSIPFPPYNSSETNQEGIQPIHPSLGSTAESHIISIPFALLLSGIVLFLFSLILLFFSKDGVLTLKWNAHYWFLYLVIALPLLLFGWKLLKTPEDSP